MSEQKTSEQKTLRQALEAWAASDAKVTLGLLLVGDRELTGQLRGVAGDTVILGSGTQSFYVAIPHIIWAQEQR